MIKSIQEIRQYYDKQYAIHDQRVYRRPSDYRIFFFKLAKFHTLSGRMLDVGYGEGYLFQVKPSEDLKPMESMFHQLV